MLADGAWFPAHPDRQTLKAKELIYINARGVSPSARREPVFAGGVAATTLYSFLVGDRANGDVLQKVADDQRPGKERRQEEGSINCG